jgi:UDP-glucose 4-epimerase
VKRFRATSANIAQTIELLESCVRRWRRTLHFASTVAHFTETRANLYSEE